MSSKKILIVDDQKFALQILRDFLVSGGFLIAEAMDGETACRKAVEFLPDLILMDLVMPGMDGVEACRRIKHDSRTAAIPLIVITANKDKEKLVAAFEAGADDYLNKPFAIHELQARINSNLIKQEAITLIKQKARDSEILLEISQAITSTLNMQEILQIIVSRIAANMAVRRCSIARIKEDDRYGYVLASSDDPQVKGLRIDLERYPEIREVIRTGKTLIVDDVKNHPLMEEVRPHIAALDFDTLLVLPVIYRSEVVGTLMLRTAREKHSFTDRELNFCSLVANVSASALKNAHLYELVLEESGELRDAKARTDLELREKAVFESLFEHASEGLMALNVRGEPVYINRSALAMLGYCRDEALNITLADFLAEESCSEALENHMNFFLGRDYRKKSDLVFKTKSGDRVWGAVSISDYRLEGHYAILSCTDITEERSFRQQLEEANERLKGLDQLKSEFIATATHELRIPVTVLHSYCSLLRELGEENLSEAQREYLHTAIEASERLVELIDDMLDLSKLESGKADLHFEEKDIMEPIREVYAVLAPFAASNGLDLSIEPFPGKVCAYFDSDKIRSVLTNLIGNAIKFTPSGGRIGISVIQDGDDVLVSVSDTGEGIPEKHISRIFDEFNQLRSRTSSKRGSGLGLAICKRIVDAHNGQMWVTSAPQKGSQFTFSLPASPASNC